MSHFHFFHAYAHKLVDEARVDLMGELMQHVVQTLKSSRAESDQLSGDLHPKVQAMLQEVAVWARRVTEDGKRHEVSCNVNLLVTIVSN